jgi:hypothetical protein
MFDSFDLPNGVDPKEVENRTGMSVKDGKLLVPMPIEANDFSSLYPSIMIAYNLSRETITQSERNFPAKLPSGDPFKYRSHDGTNLPDVFTNRNIYIQDHLDKPENMGIIPKYLLELLELRVSTKKTAARYQAKMDECEKGSPEYIEAENFYKVYSAKQLAIKVVMNTAYGATSFNFSVLYHYISAFLTTLLGRTLITLVNKYLTEAGCVLCYNDTDSAYFYHSPEKFADIVSDLILGKCSMEVYDQRMVEKSIQLLEELNPGLNKHIASFTGYTHIRMIREETLYPAVFCALKKYVGINYDQWKPNNKRILYKGISMVSRNVTKYLGDFTSNLIDRILFTRKVDVADSIYSMIDAEYDRLLSGDMGPNCNFEKKKRFKPEKNDKIIHNMRKYREITDNESVKELCADPSPLEYIRYIVCENECRFDFMGRNNKTNLSDRTYYTSVVDAENMSVDYTEAIHSLFATCSQFLSYTFGEPEDKAGVCRDMARKYLEKKYKDYEEIAFADRNSKKLAVKALAKKSYSDWINAHYDGPVLSILRILKNCSISPTDKLLTLAECCPSYNPVLFTGSEYLAIKKCYHAKILDSRFELDCIVKKLVYHYNQSLTMGEPLCDVLSDIDKERLTDIMNNCCIYSFANAGCAQMRECGDTITLGQL